MGLARLPRRFAQAPRARAGSLGGGRGSAVPGPAVRDEAKSALAQILLRFLEKSLRSNG